ncbi:MAG TPA: hypothetical protein VFH88_04380, partial [Candidatus Krumholzibacteria bacterium]|nr:hypothetical protein [Candidatus Krumholzibacteria bacterium]
LAWVVAAVATIFAAVLAWRVVGSREVKPELMQMLVDAPPDVKIANRHAELALSPDGCTVTFVADNALWVRPLGAAAATRLSNTEGAFRPFWSPDSRTIAYFIAGKLMRIPAAGGSPTSVCDAISGRGGSWSPDGTILLAPALAGPLMRVSASGGDLVAVTKLDSTHYESGHRFPCFLPDGEHFLFAAIPGGTNGWDTYVGSLRSGTVKHLLTARSVAVYAEPGYLLFERDGRVLAQRFDAGRLELRGAPVSIAEAPQPSDLDAEPVTSPSQNGRLAILRSEPANARLEIHGPTGATIAQLDLPPAPWKVSDVSPDGRRATVFKGDELWVVDLVRSVPMRIATNLASFRSSVWSPDGNQIAFVARHDEREEIYIGGLDGKADMVPTTDGTFKGVTDWSRDGRYIVFWSQNAETGQDIWFLPVDGDRKPVLYLRSPAEETGGRISPDGRWLVYTSNETGQNEIYVQSFPKPGHKVRVSLDGGQIAGWSDDGSRLRYLNNSGREFVSVPVKGTGEEFQPGAASKAGELSSDVTGGASMGSGRGSLVSVATESHPRDIRIILNWTALLEQ